MLTIHLATCSYDSCWQLNICLIEICASCNYATFLSILFFTVVIQDSSPKARYNGQNWKYSGFLWSPLHYSSSSILFLTAIVLCFSLYTNFNILLLYGCTFFWYISIFCLNSFEVFQLLTSMNKQQARSGNSLKMTSWLQLIGEVWECLYKRPSQVKCCLQSAINTHFSLL